MVSHEHTQPGDGATAVDEEPVVLIVDDESEILESYELYLSEEYDVRTASNGAKALVELSPEIDVVLLDRRMPGMSGDEVLEHITDWHSDCRVIMVTAVDAATDIVDLPFDDYLTKPVSKSDLTATIEQLLLFDRYEQLLMAYNSATRKYATLKATLDPETFESDEKVAQLESRRATLKSRLETTIDQFIDDEVSEIFRTAHSSPP